MTQNSFALRSLSRAIIILCFLLPSLKTDAQEYLYGLTKTGGNYNQGVPFQISTTGQDYIPYGHFDGINGGNAGNGAGFIQFSFNNAVSTVLYALTSAGDQNLNHGNMVLIQSGQGGLLTPSNFLLSSDRTGFNPCGKLLQASDGMLYGMTSTAGEFNGGGIFTKNAIAGPIPFAMYTFDGVNRGRSPKGSLIEGSNGMIFGMTEFGGVNDMGVIFFFGGNPNQFTKIFDFSGTTTGANPTGSLLLASDGKLYGMTRAGGASNDGIVFRINIDGSGFTKLIDFDATKGTAPLGSLIQHSDGLLYGMTSSGGSNGFGTIFSITISGTFNKVFDFDGTNGKSPVGDLVTSQNGQTMYGVAFAGGVNDKGTLFKLENGNQVTKLYDFEQATGANPVGSLMVVRKFPALTFEDMPQKTTTSPAFTPVIQTLPGLNVNLKSADETVAVIENNQIKPVGTNGAYITAFVLGNHEYLPRSVTKMIDVVKSKQTINFPSIPAMTYGDPAFTLSATSSSGLTVSINAPSNDVVTFDGTKFYIQNSGKVTMTAFQAGNSIYESASATQDLIVNKAEQVITFNPPSSRFCCQQFSLAATANSGIDTKFKTTDWQILSLANSVATIQGLGTAQVTAYNAGNSKYKAAEKTATINLLKGNQSINFSLSDNVTYPLNQADVYAPSFSSSGLPVTYTSNPPGIAVFDGEFLRIIGVGTTTITATQGGNILMQAAPAVSRTVTVQPPAVPASSNVISFVTLSSRSVDEPPFNLAGEATSGLPVTYTSSNPAVAEINGNLVTIKSTGTITITATQAGGGSFPAAVPVQRSVTITKQFQTISLDASYNVAFGDPPIQFPSRSSRNLPISYSSTNTSIAYVDANYLLRIVNSGTVTITASQSGNSIYNAASNATSQINISQLSQTVMFASLPAKTYGDAEFNLTATATSGMPVTFSSSNSQVATINGSTLTIVGAGTTNIKATQNGFPGYNMVEVIQPLTVNKATQTITFGPLPEKKFSDNSFSLSASSSTNLPVTFSSSNPAIVKVIGNQATIVGSGTVEIIATQVGDENYQPVETRQQLKVHASSNTFNFIGATTFGGENNSGTVYSMKTDGSNFSTLKSFSLRRIPSPQGGFIKGSDGKLYGHFRSSGTSNNGAIVRLESDGSGLTFVHHFDLIGGAPYGNILQASDGDLYGITRTGGVGGGLIYKIKTDGTGYTILRELATIDGNASFGGLMEASDGKLYGMTTNGGFYGYGSIFRIDKDGSNFKVVFRFNDNLPHKTGYNPRGDLVQGPDGYLYGNLFAGGENSNGILFKIHPDGSNFSKLVVFDGSLKGMLPGFTLLLGSDGKLYGVTQAGGANNYGCLFVVNTDGSNFTRLYDFDGINTGNNPIGRLTEGSDGFLYGAAADGGSNSKGTIFKIQKNGTGFQKLADMNSTAARPVGGSLVEGQPGKFFGMTFNGGVSDGGAVFSITSNGTLSVLTNFPEDEYFPIKLIGDKTGEFSYGIAWQGKPSIFKVNSSGSYESIFQIPSDVNVTQLYYLSTGHLWCVGTKNNQSFVFRIKTDGTGFEQLTGINNNIPSLAPVQWLTERLDGTVFGFSTNGKIFSTQSDGTGFALLGSMPSGVEFGTNNFLCASDGQVYAVGTYNHAFYRYGTGAMIKLADLPFDQLPAKLIELNGGRIGVALKGGHIFSVEKDGTQFRTILERNYALGANLEDMFQSYDGWIYVTANLGGTYDRGLVYKVLPDGSSYTAIHHFNGPDGNNPNNFIFKKLQQTLTFDPLEPKHVIDPPFSPVATSNSGARITFTSSNPSVAIIENGEIKPVGAGTTTITASIPANANYYATTEIQRDLIVSKSTQTITFTKPTDKVMGDPQFSLVASSDSGLDITFESMSENISITGTEVSIINAGVAKIKATQSGNAEYQEATPVSISFCVNPSQPTITSSGTKPNIVLTSSNNSGNQWYFNNELIDNATQINFQPVELGVYTVITTIEGCSSAISNGYQLTSTPVVTGVDNNPEFTVEVFPNPVTNLINVQIHGNSTREFTVELLDTFGRVIAVKKADDHLTFDISNFSGGLYIVKVISPQKIVSQKILKTK